MGIFKKRKDDANAVSPAEQRRGLMFVSAQLEKIVNIYGKSMEKTAYMVYGAPQSMLPYPKDNLKKYLTDYVIVLSKLNLLDKKSYEMIKVGFGELATFIPDEEAMKVKELNKTTLELESMPFPPTEEYMRQMNIGIQNLENIQKEMLELFNEFYEITGNLVFSK